MKIIAYATRGFLALPLEDQIKAINEFEEASVKRDDWHYTLLDKKVFAQLNEEDTYTIMLAEEY